MIVVLFFTILVFWLFANYSNKKEDQTNNIILIIGTDRAQKDRYVKSLGRKFTIVQKYDCLYQTCSKIFDIDVKSFSVTNKKRNQMLEKHWVKFTPFEILRKVDAMFVQFHPHFWILANFNTVENTLKENDVVVPNIYFQEEIELYIQHFGKERVLTVLCVPENVSSKKVTDYPAQHQFAASNFPSTSKTNANDFEFDCLFFD